MHSQTGSKHDHGLLRRARQAEQPLQEGSAQGQFDHYELARREDESFDELGRGGMGITYRAFDTILGHAVALKVFDSRLAPGPEVRECFLREARAAARLQHPNVARIFYCGVRELDGQCFIAMELVEGETLDARLRGAGPLSVKLALEVVFQVTSALVAAETQGLVHRDLKPTNLMITHGAKSLVKVIDFGLKSFGGEGKNTKIATVDEGFVGTPHFASPEQIEKRAADLRSDIYSLGATLYYLVTGHPPFDGSVAQIMLQHLHKQVPTEPLRGFPVPFVQLIVSMMKKDRDQRPQSATELQQTIQNCIRELSATVDETVTESLTDLREGLATARRAEPFMNTRWTAILPFISRQDIKSTCDRVNFSVFAPGGIRPAQQFILDLWAHLPTQTDEVTSLAGEFARDRRLGLKAQVTVVRGTALSVVLDLPSLRIKDPSDTIFWDGEPVYASFIVEVPADVATGGHVGQAIVSASGIPIAKVAFFLSIEPQAPAVKKLREGCQP
jgi:serine/threonine protein kinase